MNQNKTIRTLLLVLIILNILDTLLTTTGVYRLETIDEANPFLQPLLKDIRLFFTLKLVLLTGALSTFLVFFTKHKNPFPYAWEQRAALITLGTVTLLYLLVVLWNAVLLFTIVTNQ